VVVTAIDRLDAVEIFSPFDDDKKLSMMYNPAITPRVAISNDFPENI